jgi:hypothetical protein
VQKDGGRASTDVGEEYPLISNLLEELTYSSLIHYQTYI